MCLLFTASYFPRDVFFQVKVLLGTDWHRNYDVFKKPDYFVKVLVSFHFSSKITLGFDNSGAFNRAFNFYQ